MAVAWRSLLLLLLMALHAQRRAVAASTRPKHGHLRRPISPEERYHPSWKPAPRLRPEQLPRRFSWDDVDGRNMLTPSWQQHSPKYCGSCFVHATLSMIQDRLKIRKGGQAPDVMLGRQSFLNCAPPLGYSRGCDGGAMLDVIEYMHKYGLPDEGCLPYTATDYRDIGLQKHDQCQPIDRCRNCMPDDADGYCWAISHPTTYYVSSWGSVGYQGPDKDNEAAMMSEIYSRGPIVCSLSVPDAFTWWYDGGVFIDETNDTEVDHDVEVVGWGEDGGVPYWLVRNSWGQFWGVNGFAKIIRGVNAQQIESGDCWAADVTWQDEEDVERGRLVGSMYGLRDPRDYEGFVQRTKALMQGNVSLGSAVGSGSIQTGARGQQQRRGGGAGAAAA